MDRRAQPAYTSLLVLAAVLVTSLLQAAVAHAWRPKTQLLIAEHALKIAPPDLRRQIDKHLAQFRQGSVAPFREGYTEAHQKNSNGAGSLDERILTETRRSIEAIRAHRPFKEIVYQLGVLSHYVADANNPLSTDERDPRERDYFLDYIDYVERAQGRYSLVFYGEGRDLDGAGTVSPLLDQTLARGRRLYPTIGREYRRVGGPPGVEKFDDRSVAFAVGALALSHAVSDVGAILRYVWVEAGGGDGRDLPITSAPDAGSGR